MTKKCIHHWTIDRENKGRCRKCGEERDFKVLQEREHGLKTGKKKSGKGGRKSKKTLGNSLEIA